MDYLTGWRSQYERMKRWSRRLECVCRQPSPSAKDTDDYAGAFMVNCFHLLDWLHKDGPVSESRVRGFVWSHKYLSACRDWANDVKHYNLTRPFEESVRRSGRSGGQILTRSSTGYDMLIDEERSDVLPFGGGLEPGQYVIEVKSKDGRQEHFDLADFVHGCISEWDTFLEQEGLTVD